MTACPAPVAGTWINELCWSDLGERWSRRNAWASCAPLSRNTAASTTRSGAYCEAPESRSQAMLSPSQAHPQPIGQGTCPQCSQWKRTRAREHSGRHERRATHHAQALPLARAWVPRAHPPTPRARPLHHRRASPAAAVPPASRGRRTRRRAPLSGVVWNP